MRDLRRFLAACLSMLAIVACSDDSPTEPDGGGGTPGVWTIAVSAEPSELAVGSDVASRITVRVESSETGNAPPSGTSVVVTTTLGELASRGSGARTAVVQLAGREGAIDLFPGSEAGTALLEAKLDDSVGVRTVTIRAQGDLVLAEVVPASGAAGGGDRVTVRGGGFEEPVDVRFDGRAAIVESVAEDRVEVVTPASSQPVPAGLTRDVDVSVTVGSGAAAETRTIPGGFTYAPGGSDDGEGDDGEDSSIDVTSVSPPEGSNAGGTRVTLEGEGFEALVRVLFGQGDDAAGFVGIQATVESTSPTRVVVVSPPALGFTIDNRDRIVDLLVQNVSSGESTVVPEVFRYRD